MRIIDPSDPVLQAELREQRWDAKCEAYPKCRLCKGSLYPYDTYTKLGEHLYCQRCINLGTHSTDSLEVF